MFLVPDVKIAIDQALAYANEEIEYFKTLHSSFTAYRVTDLSVGYSVFRNFC